MKINAQVTSKNTKFRRPSPQKEDEGSMARRKKNAAETTGTLRRGDSDGMIVRTYWATGEALLVPGRNSWKKGASYNCQDGKWMEDERESEGHIVATNRGNARGAKVPCR